MIEDESEASAASPLSSFFNPGTAIEIASVTQFELSTYGVLYE